MRSFSTMISSLRAAYKILPLYGKIIQPFISRTTYASPKGFIFNIIILSKQLHMSVFPSTSFHRTMITCNIHSGKIDSEPEF